MKRQVKEVILLGGVLMVALLLFIKPEPLQAQISSTANQWASWVSVNTHSTTTITPPSLSQNVYINNGDSADAICVNAKGGALDNRCNAVSGGNIQIPAGSSLNLDNYHTDSITIRAVSNTASPVSVFVGY